MDTFSLAFNIIVIIQGFIISAGISVSSYFFSLFTCLALQRLLQYSPFGISLQTCINNNNNNKYVPFYVPFLRIGPHSPLQCKEPTHSRSNISLFRTHTHKHTHTHTHTHTPVSYTHLTLPTMAVV